MKASDKKAKNAIPKRPEDLKPWMRGPFELIRHADGHLHANEDTDRRIALIGFDNAIEVSIDVFVRLHPMMRDGLQITKVEVENAQRNYHTKIEFLDGHVQANQIPLSIQVDEIVWYHQLRNELYHSGNGMVPEHHVIAGARSAALAVFQALFGADVSGLLGDVGQKAMPTFSQPIIQSQNPEMEFLRWFIELEQEVRKFAPAEGGRPMPPTQTWRALLKVRPDLRDLDARFSALMRTRNAIVHGVPVEGNVVVQFESLMGSILEIIDRLSGKLPK